MRGSDLTILAYHRVFSMVDEAGYPFDPELISASPEEFRWQVRHLKQNYDVVSFRDVITHLDSNAKLPRRCLIVTFDDGFEDNYSVAYPILREARIPATFFVSSGFIGQSSTFWFDSLANQVKRAPPQSIAISEASGPLPRSSLPSDREAAFSELIGILKRVPDSRRREVLTKIDALIGMEPNPKRASLSTPMTWNNVIEMANGGMEIGSHTVTHPILSNVDSATLESEMTESKRQIESAIERTVEVLAYPVGTTGAYDEQTISAARNAGYRLACSYEYGPNNVSTLDRFALKRQHVERYTDRLRFRGLAALPSLVR